jgi:hypothetical protein
MADFEELLTALQNPGEDGPGETIYDDLRASYNDRVSAGDAKVAELTASGEASTAEISKLKSHNYDLLQQVQRGNPPTVNGRMESSSAEPLKEVTLDDIISYE